MVQKCTSVELRLSQYAHSPTPGGRGRTSRTSSGRNFRPDVPVRAFTDVACRTGRPVRFRPDASGVRSFPKLRLVARIQGEGTFLPLSQALANLEGEQWREFDIHRNQIPTELINRCYTEAVEQQLEAQTRDRRLGENQRQENPSQTHRKVIAIFCDAQERTLLKYYHTTPLKPQDTNSTTP